VDKKISVLAVSPDNVAETLYIDAEYAYGNMKPMLKNALQVAADAYAALWFQRKNGYTISFEHPYDGERVTYDEHQLSMETAMEMLAG
jgi:hypothetical protein